MSDDVLWEDNLERSGHSIFRPSYSATFLSCAGSLIPSQTAEDSAGYDAAVGTVFHEVMAEWQTNGRPDHWLGETRTIINQHKDGSQDIFTVTIDEDMFSFGEECLRRYEDIPGDRFYETRVDISDITPIPGQGGTADLAICQLGFLDIIDWKYGTGVQVWAFRNTQILLYAWGFFVEFDRIYHFQTIRLHIAQPRLGHFDVWEITREELIEFSVFAKQRMIEAWVPNAPRHPTPKGCQWCRVRLDCAALEAAREAICDQTFEVLDEPVTHEDQKAVVARNSPPPTLEPPVSLSTAQLAKILSYRKMMEAWFKEAHEVLISRGLAGEDLVYFKVVDGRSRRAYVDEDEAVESYRTLGLTDDDIFAQKLKSPNQMEPTLRAIGIRGKLTKDYLRVLAPPQPGRPTLVPDGDARAEIPSIIDDTFEAEDEL